MKISIVIPVYNEDAYLPACLNALTKQVRQPDEVIIVNNGSTDNLKGLLKKYDFVTLIHQPTRGIANASKKGFDTAKGDVIARLDADSVAPKDWLQQIEQHFLTNPDVQALTGAPRFYDVPIPVIFNVAQALLYQYMQRTLTGTYFLWGANMALRHSAWQQVSGVVSLRTDIDDDIDLSLCMRNQGLHINYLPTLTVRASFLRGNLGLRRSVNYIRSWPQDYWLHSLRVRGLIVALVSTGLIALTLPFTLHYELTN